MREASIAIHVDFINAEALGDQHEQASIFIETPPAYDHLDHLDFGYRLQILLGTQQSPQRLLHTQIEWRTY